MTKYQLEHFKDKVNRQFEPLIRDQELLVKQFKTAATDKAVEKLSKKIGADTIIKKFAEAEKKLEEARATALTFFEKKKPKDQELAKELATNLTGKTSIFGLDPSKALTALQQKDINSAKAEIELIKKNNPEFSQSQQLQLQDLLQLH